MKVAVLFSGGKDSSFALLKARQHHEIVCLVSILSENKESYMFQTANVEITKIQAEAMELPIIQKKTKGEKENELEDLRDALIEAKEKYGAEGIATGALKSIYQSSRIQKICCDLDLWCFNPLWLKDQVELLNEVLENGFEAIISGVFAFPLDQSYLGKEIDRDFIEKMKVLHEKYAINPAGEGGEIETTVLNAPMFKKRIEIKNAEVKWEENSGVYQIKSTELKEK